MRPSLTPRQSAFLDYLKKTIRQQGIVPSLREAGEELGVSHMAVAQQIRALEAKGYLKRDRRYGREIHLCADALMEEDGRRQGRIVPIVGKIAAGLPLYAQQEWDGHIVVDPTLYADSGLFALRVKGDSMIKVGIMDGDLVLCEPRQYAANGEIVVALIRNEEATVKRFFLGRDRRRIELRPENDRLASIFYELSDILIQGKVVGLHRGPEAFAVTII